MGGLIFAQMPVFIVDRTETTVYVFAVIGGIIAFTGLLWGWLNIKCPHCGHSLLLRGGCVECCPYCGGKIE